MAADRKTTDHTAITAAQVDTANDLFEIVDVSDTTDSASGTNKKMTVKEATALFNALEIMTGTTQNRRHSGFVSGTVNNSTVVATINVLRAYPLVVTSRLTIDKLGLEVTTGTTGAIIAGIYASDGTDKTPGTLLVDSGVLNITTPAVYEGLSVSSYVLEPGMYWIAHSTNTGNTFRAIDTLRCSPILGLPSTYGASYGVMWSVARTYDGTLPSTFTAGGSLLTTASGNSLLICFRAI